MCKKPLNINDSMVKCGHCIECLIQRSQEWAFRLEQELIDATSGAFITLTYSDENVPIVGDENGEIHTTLKKSDLQKFMKRLRYENSKYEHSQSLPVRFFACGEYGGKTKRAHYHAIILNLEKQTKEKILKIWNKGFVKIGDVNPKSIRYVTNYMLLKDIDCLDIQEKPFTTMSRRPGIGAGYVTRYFNKHIKSGSHKLVSASKNRKNLYRYYQEKVLMPEQIEKAKEKKNEEYERYSSKVKENDIKNNPQDPFKYRMERYAKLEQKTVNKLKEKPL